MKKILLIAATALLCALPLLAYDYYMADYDVNITVAKDARHNISETLDFMFLKAKHGYYRSIPYDYGKNRVKISKIESSEHIELDSLENGYRIYKIGDADHTYVGQKSYSLSFVYDIGADQNEGYDEFYYNIVGTDWQMPIEHLSFTLRLPDTVNASQVWLTRGYYGSTSSSGVSWKISGDTITGTAEALSPGEAITVRIQFPDGYYQGARRIYDWALIFRMIYLVAALAAMVVCVLIWDRHGRDKMPIVVAKFTNPDNMSPLQMGYIADTVVDDKDLTSMLFYWADQGCLTIKDEDKKLFLTKVREPEDCPGFEKTLFDAFFDSADESGTIEVGKLGAGFATKVEAVKALVRGYYKGKRALVEKSSQAYSVVPLACAVALGILYSLGFEGYFDSFGFIVGIILSVVTTVVLLLSYYLFFQTWFFKKTRVFSVIFRLLTFGLDAAIFVGAGLLFGLPTMTSLWYGLLGSATVNVLCLLCAIIPRRSDFGQRMLENALGYREFIEKVEIDKLKMMIDEDPEIFYHVLSFAIVLGLEDKWARKFAGIYTAPPAWYAGPNPAMDMLFFSHLSSRYRTSIRSAGFASTSSGKPSMSFGGSSFGGGGFSGGGFGGGGGGAW